MYALGEDFLPDASAVEQALPEDIQEILDGQSANTLPDTDLAERIWHAFQEVLQENITAAFHTAGVILAVTVICALAESVDIPAKGSKYILLAGVVAVSAAAISDFDSYLENGLSSLQVLSDFSHVLLPSLTTAAAVSGVAAGAAAKYAATAMFMDVLLSVGQNLVMPAVCGYAALSVACAAVGNGALKAARKIVKCVCTYLLIAVSLLFTTWLAITGVVSGAADAVAVKITKTAVSAALPIVGSVLSDAAGTLAAVVSTVRNTAGIFGMIVILCICMGPFVSLGVRYLIYKLSAALCECVSNGKLSELVDAFGTCFGMVLGMNGVGAWILLLSVFSLMRTVIQ